jgi:hypothetical protein
MPQADKLAAGSIKLARSVALRSTENPFIIVLPLKIDAGCQWSLQVGLAEVASL